jgi:hypothetical protein
MAMTLDTAKTRIIGILTRRRSPLELPPNINAINAENTSVLWPNVVQPQLTATRKALPAGTATGSCTYTVDGQAITVTDVTRAECDALGGTFA